MAPPSVEYLPEPLGKEKEIREILEKPVKFDFVDATLGEARTHLMDKYNIEVIIQGAKLDENPWAEVADVNFSGQEIACRTGLKQILGPKDMTFLIRDGTLVFAKKSDLSQKLFVLTYPVRDLVEDCDNSSLTIRFFAEYHCEHVVLKTDTNLIYPSMFC